MTDEPITRTYLLNCRFCHWHTTVESDAFMNVDFERDLHEQSLRNALSVGPYCPKRSVAIAQLPEDATCH